MDEDTKQKEYQSILHSTKKALGLLPEYEPFDAELIMHINSTFATLHQLGVGPEEPFAITGAEETWDQFTTDPLVRQVRTYMALKVKSVFDPPTAATMFDAVNRQIAELEWRLNVAAEKDKKWDDDYENFGKEEDGQNG